MKKIKIWINKSKENKKSSDFTDALTFNINVSNKSNLLSNIREGLYKLGVRNLPSLYEDLFIFSLSVFAADKRLSRSSFSDNWTRNICINIPVTKIEQWNSVKVQIEKMLSFLSGDIWSIEFRKADSETIYQNTRKRDPLRPPLLNSIDSVSLFSGGLDSFCGAYELLSAGKNTLFVGFQEYGKLSQVQSELFENLNLAFPNIKKSLFTFSAKAYKPFGNQEIKPENTSRSRSLLFLCTAICIAEVIGKNVPVYIPENGFIGLNLPLTSGRKGSCSTRTTHPFFISQLNSVMEELGISHRVSNPYAFQTKREMVKKFSSNGLFVNGIGRTISCSHPCNGRWVGISEPQNCGYCYPCLIRRSSLIGLNIPLDQYTYDIINPQYINSSTPARHSDLIDLISSVDYASSASDTLLLKSIMHTGKLSKEEALRFLDLYKSTIRDLIEFFSANPSLLHLEE